MACGMLLLLVECAYCMRAASIACGMCLSLVDECFYCLWNAFIACGIYRLPFDCGYFWNVYIACGMLLLLVASIDCMRTVYLPTSPSKGV